ncbi:MAG: hypothetical protein IPP08_01090 [Chlorobiota bacterium]|nr:hypothetical protein [Chlorobiota bacterium]QQS66802.1 MAG: hypothetical protein IPP08_01090 [Chlorobiota bacterium]
MLVIYPLNNLTFKSNTIGDSVFAQNAIALACLSTTESIITNVPDDHDTDLLIKSLIRIGFCILRESDKILINPLAKDIPNEKFSINFENAGYAMRIFIAIAQSQNVNGIIESEFPLSKRNIERTLIPLRELGCEIICSERGTSPVRIFPNSNYNTDVIIDLPIPNFYLKSSLIIASSYSGLNTEIIEPYPSRSITEYFFDCNLDFNKSYHINVKPNVYNGFNAELPSDTLICDCLTILGLLSNKNNIELYNRSCLFKETTFLNYIPKINARFGLIHNNCNINYLKSETLIPVYSNISGKLVLNCDDVKNLGSSIVLLSTLIGAGGGEIIVKGAIDMRQQTCDRILAIVNNYEMLGIETEEFEDGFRVKNIGSLKGGCELNCYNDLYITLSQIILCSLADSHCTLINLNDDYRVKTLIDILQIKE